jgi:hypothetical protein
MTTTSGTPGTTTVALTANQIEITKFYLAAFNRAPETTGLNYWADLLDAGETLDQVVQTIYSLPVVQVIYPADINDHDFLQAVYHNVFGKVPDDKGLAYWTGRLHGGVGRGEILLSMVNAGLGTPDGTPGKDFVTNRVEVAKYAAIQQIRQDHEMTVADLIDLLGHVDATAASVTTARTTVDQSTGALITGVAVDGYIAGMTVFVDYNHDGKWNYNEPHATTLTKGNFAVPNVDMNQMASLVGFDGTDTTTGLANNTVMTAPAGSQVINSLTTFIQSVLSQDTSSNKYDHKLADAQNFVKTALGITDASVDLLRYDPLAAALNSGTSAADQTTRDGGVAILAIMNKLGNVITGASEALVASATVGTTSKLEPQAALTATMDALIAAVKADADEATGDGDGKIDLNDGTLLSGVFKGALENSTVLKAMTGPNNSNLVDDKGVLSNVGTEYVNGFGTLYGTASKQIDLAVGAGNGASSSSTIAVLSGLARVSVVTQGDLTDQFSHLAKPDSTDHSTGLDALKSDYSDAKFATKANEAVTQDLAPGIKSVPATESTPHTPDTPDTPDTPGMPDMPDTPDTTTSSPSGSSVDLDHPSPETSTGAGTQISPAVIDASKLVGTKIFNDDIALPSFARVINLDYDSLKTTSIVFTHLGMNDLVVANDGADLVFTANDASTVSQLILVGVAAPGDIIDSLDKLTMLLPHLVTIV